MANKSEGDHWGDEYFQSSLRAIDDFAFVHRVFATGPGLVSRPDGSEWKSTLPYNGGEYDSTKFDLVEGAWAHDHCFVCGDRFEDGDSFWVNTPGVVVCDTCHEHIQSMHDAPSQEHP